MKQVTETSHIHITANGEPFTVAFGTRLSSFVEGRSLSLDRVVVELNGLALPPSQARSQVLNDGDRLEIVRIVAGG